MNCQIFTLVSLFSLPGPKVLWNCRKHLMQNIPSAVNIPLYLKSTDVKLAQLNTPMTQKSSLPLILEDSVRNNTSNTSATCSITYSLPNEPQAAVPVCSNTWTPTGSDTKHS